MEERSPTNFTGTVGESLRTTEENPTKPLEHSRKKMVLLIGGVFIALQCMVFVPSWFLNPVQVNSNSRTKPYRILIFGQQDHLSQRLEFLRKVDGVWQHEFSCGDNVKMVVTVGEYRAHFVDQDAVVFNMDEPAVKRDYEMLVSMRSDPRQAWLYYGRESAIRMRWLFKPYCGSVPLHGVWSFHNDSEVLMRYGSFVRGKPATPETKTPEEWLRGKSKLVAWMARNCAGTFWPRTAYVESLQEHITVDVYGLCGDSPMVCPFEPLSECWDILKQYKFYLAFESAECHDYATEKLWQTAYMNGIVPVVYGAQRDFYEKEAPPDSFIYAGDFNTAQDLAQYLLYLAAHPKLYVKYFEWRYVGHIEVPKQLGEPFPAGLFCSLIPFIHKVQQGELTKKPLSEFPYYNSCKMLQRLNGKFHPTKHQHLGHWKPNY